MQCLAAFVVAAIVMPMVPARADSALHCRNTTSGATWDLPVDLGHGTVDSYPAQITDRAISWVDTSTGRFYDFDRASGAMDMHVASSTGGFYLTDQCRLK
ncbi:hypothetical protein [Acidisoma cladoniae]|uniref:hypothetical protein n=1 Tax=Acidisoma cladoniae TaxID=3040935 RepID=UPI0025513663|nr:hypothetical protein [Acidisoma sp. PAMC 29798]